MRQAIAGPERAFPGVFIPEALDSTLEGSLRPREALMSTELTQEEKAAKYDEQKAKQKDYARYYQKVRNRMLKNWHRDSYADYQAHWDVAIKEIAAEEEPPRDSRGWIPA
jgi:hypothetical protein